MSGFTLMCDRCGGFSHPGACAFSVPAVPYPPTPPQIVVSIDARTYLAGQALYAMLANDTYVQALKWMHPSLAVACAERAVIYADALIAELAKPKEAK